MWALVSDLWEIFHRVWGQAARGHYDKREWANLQEKLAEVLRRVGLERRRQNRDPFA